MPSPKTCPTCGAAVKPNRLKPSQSLEPAVDARELLGQIIFEFHPDRRGETVTTAEVTAYLNERRSKL